MRCAMNFGLTIQFGTPLLKSVKENPNTKIAI